MLVDSEGKTCQSTTSLLFMITPPPPFSWIFTKYANEWPPRKKIRKVSTRKKINTKKEPEVVNTKKDPEVVNTKKKPEVVNTKKEPEVARDLWPLTRDLWPLTLTRKRSSLTTHVEVTLLTWYNSQHINNFIFLRWFPGKEDTYEATDQFWKKIMIIYHVYRSPFAEI